MLLQYSTRIVAIVRKSSSYNSVESSNFAFFTNFSSTPTIFYSKAQTHTHAYTQHTDPHISTFDLSPFKTTMASHPHASIQIIANENISRTFWKQGRNLQPSIHTSRINRFPRRIASVCRMARLILITIHTLNHQFFQFTVSHTFSMIHHQRHFLHSVWFSFVQPSSLPILLRTPRKVISFFYSFGF